jgi:phospholipid transport system substrate-binding protein
MVKRVLTIVTVLVFLCSGGIALASEAQVQLKVSMDKLIDVLGDESLKGPDKKDERRTKIFSVLEERFDFRAMGMRALGANWKTLSPPQQEEFTGAFSELLKKSYILKLERYTNEKVVFKDERPKGKYYYIYTEIISGEKAIPINYSLYDKAGQWLVYDVVIEGVSLVKNYRTQFNQALKKEKFAGLMDKLNKQVSSLNEELKEQ